MSICALNSVVETHLAIIDGLEGSDGRGNFIRLDTLIAGRNPVARTPWPAGWLGLAYAVDSTTRPCYLLPEGIVDALERFEQKWALFNNA
jgi:hypothetical protein